MAPRCEHSDQHVLRNSSRGRNERNGHLLPSAYIYKRSYPCFTAHLGGYQSFTLSCCSFPRGRRHHCHAESQEHARLNNHAASLRNE
ncbi:rCG58234, isoform CRA_a [Rattus norvegicus]|uniref:RCG58234, isoform CRA_a n=1 Tax=Rattus norvegicus TaxID=10116 RepID=A6J517_RAT|nr:rCG58234, isoform CRA_a [Rattus norvegicus]